jgi:hypothetical protein
VVGACTTGSTGECYAGSLTTGDYLVLVRYFDMTTGKLIYLGQQEAATDFVSGLAVRGFQLVKKFKNGVFQGYGADTKSTILIIDPS